MSTQKTYNLHIRNTWKLLLLILVFLILLIYQLFWLVGILLCLIGLHKIFSYLTGLIKQQTIRKGVKIASFLVLVLLISMVAKVLLFGVFQIPSSSMENTLYPKDVILVNKLSYGPKLPLSYTEIPWINLLTKGTIQEEPWSYRRWSGVNTIQSGDVLVFESIKTPFAVKRCIGTPGDELKIVKGEIFLNEKKFKSPNHVKQMYDIEVSDKPSFYSALDSLNVESNLFPIKGSLMISGSLSYKDYLLVSKINVVKKITQKVEKKNKAQLFPTTSFDRWTLDEMTVFTIPKKEWTIELNEVNFHLYQKTIQRYENISIVRLEEGFFANGKQISTYTFTKDYLFVMGDHRKNSVDSRHFGFVPIEAVVGKVQCVLYSNYKDKFQWDRLLKNVQESQ